MLGQRSLSIRFQRVAGADRAGRAAEDPVGVIFQLYIPVNWPPVTLMTWPWM